MHPQFFAVNVEIWQGNIYIYLFCDVCIKTGYFKYANIVILTILLPQSAAMMVNLGSHVGI